MIRPGPDGRAMASGRRRGRAATRGVTLEAEGLLAHTDPAELNAELRRIAESFDDRSPDERRRVQQLALLLEGDRGAAEALALCWRAGRVSIHRADDAMSVTMDVLPPIAGGDPATLERALEALDEAGIRYGIDAAGIERAVGRAAGGEEVAGVTAAVGQPARPGRDQQAELAFRPRIDEAPQRKLLSPDVPEREKRFCRAGDVILRLTPASPAETGHNVLGEPLRGPDPLAFEIEAGDRVERRGQEFLAQADGLILFDGRRIAVRKLLIVDEDVTRQTGPIEFDGDVSVTGAVRSGAVVRASGAIVIEGPVEAATVESTGGSVELRHGIAGRCEGVVRAAMDVVARYVENATVDAGQTVVVKLGVLNGQISAGRSICIVQGKAQVIDVALIAGELVEARQIGSSSGVPTEVHVGIGAELLRSLSRIQEQLGSAQVRSNRAKELADRMEHIVGDIERLTAKEAQVYRALRKTQIVMESRIARLSEDRDALLQESSADREGRVVVLDRLMPRTIVRIGNHEHEIEEEQRHCRVTLDAERDTIAIDPA